MTAVSTATPPIPTLGVSSSLPMVNMAKPILGDEERAAIMRVLDSGIIVQGPMVKEFEDKWAAMNEVKHAIACANGTVGLHLGLLAAGVQPGDEVIGPAFSFIATANAAVYCQAKPVFVDIEAATFNLDVAQIEAAITPRTKAIMPVSLYGLPANMPAIAEIAARHGLVIVEDACQAVAASIDGRHTGTWGIGVFSLYATKNVTTAEGGILTTDNDEYADYIRVARAQGMRVRYHHDMVGFNYRMTDIQGAIGSAQMERLNKLTEIRRQHAAYYDANLRGVETPFVPAGYHHVYHQYTIKLPAGMNRDEARKQLLAKGIGSEVYYPIPIYRQKPYLAMGYDMTLPVTEDVTARCLSIPIHPALTQEELERVVDAVNNLQ